MSHSNTARMLGYWEARREAQHAPARSSIDPAEFSDVVTQAFVIGRGRAGAYPFRLAGALLDDLHRSPLTGLDFCRLWAIADLARVQSAIEGALRRRESLILHAQGRSAAGHQARLEILLAPLAGTKGQIDRLLGLYQPVTPLFRLRGEKLERLFLLEAVLANGGDPAPSALRIAAIDGRRIA